MHDLCYILVPPINMNCVRNDGSFHPEILDVECIKPRRDDRDFIDKLVISDENKHMIKASQ